MREDPVLTSSRREMSVAVVIWALALIYTIGYCSLFGYHRTAESLTFVLGFPDWIFYGLVVPWVVSTVVSGIFAFAFMRDEDLESAPPITSLPVSAEADST